jgi:hypothetical protein
MNKFFLNVLATLMSAAIVANVAFMFKVSDRLARLETKLEFQSVKVSQR